MSPLPHIGRTVVADTELAGHRFRAGELVSLGFAAANRDPRVFETPEHVSSSGPPTGMSPSATGPTPASVRPWLAWSSPSCSSVSPTKVTDCDLIDRDARVDEPPVAIATAVLAEPVTLRIS